MADLAIRFDVDAAEAAHAQWGFNCGPAALCAITGKTPTEIRPYMGEFERKGYTNPTLMAAALRHLGLRFERRYETRGAAQGRRDVGVAAREVGRIVTLRYLISEATALAGGDTCLAGHDWRSEGGRPCPRGFGRCSQTVYRCARCGDYDYGEPGGPAWEECRDGCSDEARIEQWQ